MSESVSQSVSRCIVVTDWVGRPGARVCKVKSKESNILERSFERELYSLERERVQKVIGREYSYSLSNDLSLREQKQKSDYFFYHLQT